MNRLIAQAETQLPDAGDRYFGVEVFHDPEEGYFTTRFHCRKYDGIRVAESHTTDPVRLEAQDTGSAVTEARAQWHLFMDLYDYPLPDEEDTDG